MRFYTTQQLREKAATLSWHIQPEPWSLADIGWLAAAIINAAVLLRLALMFWPGV